MDRLKKCIENLVSAAGYVGLFSVEMMHCKDDDKFYFTEINLRNDGAEAFVTKYGANLPLNHVEDLLRLAIDKADRISPWLLYLGDAPFCFCCVWRYFCLDIG